MATGFTSERATEILEKRLEGAWVGLSTTEPKQDGSNVDEPFYGGYQRQQVTHWDEQYKGQVANTEILFLFEATFSHPKEWTLLTHLFGLQLAG